MNRYLYYAFWTIIIGVTLYFGNELSHSIKEKVSTTGRTMPNLVFQRIYPIFIGMVLKFPRLWEQRHETIWGLDLPKLLIIGIPSGYIALTYIWASIPLDIPRPFLWYIMTKGGSSLITVPGVIFGYVVIGSFRVSKKS
ncbi:hypothetical protein GLW08_19615 [Pontibacillus yanchengensis]|uniref:Uncharacterized protein n=2 Tax=Pontibacillus yanchengensis TaxID=462910 RepID=A0A6I5A1K3_9BACI|nr:hypothetical protein [Pontibacillus yanchengensis]MYL34282.1 hypothetical protein [Pontibacillus yanchengensis]MYL55516.1 hypothetical protein [Pontibacillus yanchengensis]